ncbi:uncharacterized protein LOC136771961 isoform X2 [Amia ocellicauda]|uniref:uncharacterized protein LOC136771961 isoform X2 n=1 Tax=Amia ocellicauda TaxID=2972642 RepID=UPI0034646209
MAVDSERGLLLLLLLLSTAAPLTGVAVYSTVGGSATLPCEGATSGICSSIYWVFHKDDAELVGGGRVTASDPERAGRLSVKSDCSLHIDRLHTQDTGHYYCRPHFNGDDYLVNLALLSVDVPPETELKAGSTVTLRCLLHTGHGPGDCSHPYTSADVRLSWVSETGAELQGDTYQISTDQPCLSTLTVRLQTSDHNTQWRCDLTEGGAVRVSQRHTIKLTDVLSSGPSQLWIIGGTAVLLCVLGLVLGVWIWMSRRRRTRSGSEGHLMQCTVDSSDGNRKRGEGNYSSWSSFLQLVG